MKSIYFYFKLQQNTPIFISNRNISSNRSYFAIHFLHKEEIILKANIYLCQTF